MACNKKAAIELSIGTVVIIVIAMTMLIMGIVLVRNIFAGATDSVNSLNDKVKGEITNLFVEESSKIGIKLGSTKQAKVKAGTTDFGIAVGARTDDNSAILPAGANLKYQLDIGTQGSDCDITDFKSYIKDPRIETGTTSACLEFDDISGPNGYSLFLFDIPKGATECTQKIKMTTYKGGSCTPANMIEQSVFRVQIIAGGIFS